MPEPITSEVAQPAPAVQSTSVAPVQPVAQPAQAPVVTTPQTLPTEASERTREQFDKLLDSNKKLYDTVEVMRQELERRNQAAQVFQPVQQAQPVRPQQQPEQLPKADDFIEVDPYTGQQTVNLEKFNSAVESFNKNAQTLTERATRAEQAISNYIQTNEQREIERQNKEAFASHPELDPKNPNFDAQFSDFTRAVIYDSLINEYRYGGKPLSFRDAADLVKSRTSKGVVAPVKMEATTSTEQIAAQQQATQEAKEQGSLEATGQPQREAAQASQVNLEELRSITRGSGPDSDRAIAMRLQNIDHMRNTSEEEA